MPISPIIPLEKLRRIRIDEDGEIGKLVQLADPAGGSCTAMTVINPGGFRSRGVAYLTGSKAGQTAFVEELKPVEREALDVTKLAKICVSNIEQKSADPANLRKVLVAVDEGNILVTQCNIMGLGHASLVISGPSQGRFMPQRASLVEIGDLTIEWQPIWP